MSGALRRAAPAVTFAVYHTACSKFNLMEPRTSGTSASLVNCNIESAVFWKSAVYRKSAQFSSVCFDALSYH